MRTAVQHKTRSAAQARPSRTLLADASAWEQGAREEFDALVEFIRTAPMAPGAEGAVMARLAVVGAALIKCMGARRDAGSRRRRRSGRSA